MANLFLLHNGASQQMTTDELVQLMDDFEGAIPCADIKVGGFIVGQAHYDSGSTKVLYKMIGCATLLKSYDAA